MQFFIWLICGRSFDTAFCVDGREHTHICMYAGCVQLHRNILQNNCWFWQAARQRSHNPPTDTMSSAILIKSAIMLGHFRVLSKATLTHLTNYVTFFYSLSSKFWVYHRWKDTFRAFDSKTSHFRCCCCCWCCYYCCCCHYWGKFLLKLAIFTIKTAFVLERFNLMSYINRLIFNVLGVCKNKTLHNQTYNCLPLSLLSSIHTDKQWKIRLLLWYQRENDAIKFGLVRAHACSIYNV